MNKIIFISKADSIRLSDHLTSDEVRCRCSYDSCTMTQVSSRVIHSFERLREHWRSSIIVTSGFRCQVHNHNVGGLSSSMHKLGYALDLAPSNGDLVNFEIAARLFFDVTVTYNEKKFIHCHNIPLIGVNSSTIDPLLGIFRSDFVTKQD